MGVGGCAIHRSPAIAERPVHLQRRCVRLAAVLQALDTCSRSLECQLPMKVSHFCLYHSSNCICS